MLYNSYISEKLLILRMQKFIRVFFPIYIISVIILLLFPSHKTGINLNFNLFGIQSDKYIHAILFLPFLIFTRILFPRTNFFIFFFWGVFFCSFCESMHYFIPYREFSITDYYANITGLTLGGISYLISKKN